MNQHQPPSRNLLSERFSDALVFATALHADQTRKVSNTPYVSHLLRVTGIVLEHGANEDEAIAALLHDAVEDQGGADARRQIRDRYGETVALIVDGLSDTDQMPKPPWRARKEAYIAHLETASESVRLVSAADKLDNARSVLESYREHGEALWNNFKGRRDDTLWYHRSVVEVLKRVGNSPLVEELDYTVSRLEALR
jgi:(p)ppGpp synthase/HD superfamily hydrolase